MERRILWLTEALRYLATKLVKLSRLEEAHSFFTKPVKKERGSEMERYFAAKIELLNPIPTPDVKRSTYPNFYLK